MEYAYSLNTTTGNGSVMWPVVFTTGGSSSSGNYVYSGGGSGGGSGGYTAPAPRPPTALEWLDAEIEKVCKLARLAGSGAT